MTLNSSTGVMTGVIDSNVFHDFGYGSNTGYGIAITELWQYGGSGYDYSGNNAWTRALGWGTSDFAFIEDNVFENVTYYTRHLVMGDSGAKYVVRYNTFDINKDYSGTHSEVVDAHGLCYSGTGMGARGGEIYGNTFKGIQDQSYKVRLRGGTWLVYDNGILTPSQDDYGEIDVVEYRASNCSACASSHSGVTGYKQCLASNGSDYPAPHQVTGSYFWSNLYNGVNVAPVVSRDGSSTVYIQEGRDIFTSESKPSALSGYNAYTYPHPLRKLP
jgi:hypothetical protein